MFRQGSGGIPVSYCHFSDRSRAPLGTTSSRYLTATPFSSFAKGPLTALYHLNLIDTRVRAVEQVTMAAGFQSFLLLVAVLAVRVLGQCVSYGIDYANGGEYNIDSTLNEYFSFTTVFQGTTHVSQIRLQSGKELFPNAVGACPGYGFV